MCMVYIIRYTARMVYTVYTLQVDELKGLFLIPKGKNVTLYGRHVFAYRRTKPIDISLQFSGKNRKKFSSKILSKIPFWYFANIQKTFVNFLRASVDGILRAFVYVQTFKLFFVFSFCRPEISAIRCN